MKKIYNGGSPSGKGNCHFKLPLPPPLRLRLCLKRKRSGRPSGKRSGLLREGERGKLFKFQKKIQSEKNPRLCRNLQRLLRRTRSIQLLVIDLIIEYIMFSKLTSKQYRYFLTCQIEDVLWVFSLSPLLENNHLKILTGQTKVYEDICRVFNHPSTQHIVISQFSNYLNQRSKYWILSNLLIEKKFFLNWSVRNKYNLSLKILFKNFLNCDFSNFLNNTYDISSRGGMASQGNSFVRQKLTSISNYSKKKNHAKHSPDVKTNRINKYTFDFVEYNGLLLLSLKTKKNYPLIQECFNEYIKINGLKIKYMKVYSLQEGFNFLGWFFKKNTHSFFEGLSSSNRQSHQKELKSYLKTSTNKPVDEIIYGLNRKIICWQKFYSCSMKLTYLQMNDFLFFQIWYWIRKRHRNKGSKWLYDRYWKKSTPKKWIFSANDETLVFYKGLKVYCSPSVSNRLLNLLTFCFYK